MAGLCVYSNKGVTPNSVSDPKVPTLRPASHAWPGPVCFSLLYFVFCLSPCRVNICYLNECDLLVFEILHFSPYFGSVRWPEAPSSHWDHGVAEKKSAQDAPYQPYFHCFMHIDIYTRTLTHVHICSFEKTFPECQPPARQLLGLGNLEVNQTACGKDGYTLAKTHFSVSGVSCKIIAPSIHCS